MSVLDDELREQMRRMMASKVEPRAVQYTPPEPQPCECPVCDEEPQQAPHYVSQR